MNTLRKSLITVLSVVCFIASSHASDAINFDDAKVGKISSSHAGEIAAVIACKNIIDGGNARLNIAMKNAQVALGNALNDKIKGRDLAEQIRTTIESKDPASDLVSQFDAVRAPESMRKNKCEQLISGNASRADETDRKYGIK